MLWKMLADSAHSLNDTNQYFETRCIQTGSWEFKITNWKEQPICKNIKCVLNSFARALPSS